MGSRSTEFDDRPTVDGTPEDVGALISWAKRAAAEARTSAHLQNEGETQASRGSPVGSAEDAARKAACERVEAARRAEAAARASALALREERETAEAHSSARRQALGYRESGVLLRQLAGPQPFDPPAGAYGPVNGSQNDLRGDGPGNLQQFLHRGWQDFTGVPGSTSSAPWTTPRAEVPAFADPVRSKYEAGFEGTATKMPGSGVDEELPSAPAWLSSPPSPARAHASPVVSQGLKGDASGGDTLQGSRERVAARWFALKGVFEEAGPELPARQPFRTGNGKIPVVAVFSLAGGVGKTSLIATLGRALASRGEKVVLADTTSQGLLAIYFGARGSPSAAVESVPPADDSADPPVSLAIHDLAGRAEDDRQRDILAEEIVRNSDGSHRLLLDLSTGSSWLIGRLVDLHPTVLVPIAPDMNSVISLQAVERLFRGLVDCDGRPLLPFYVLNQFDASLPLHLDVREVFRRQLGDRLLNFAIRRSPAVGEALADGMTVLDYAPDATVSQDYRNIALWLRSVSPPATERA